MKNLLLIIALLSISACSSTPKPKGFELPPALSEVYRGGVLKGLEYADSSNLGMPNQYDLVDHVCISSPIFNIDGFYVRTDVRCW